MNSLGHVAAPWGESIQAQWAESKAVIQAAITLSNRGVWVNSKFHLARIWGYSLLLLTADKRWAKDTGTHGAFLSMIFSKFFGALGPPPGSELRKRRWSAPEGRGIATGGPGAVPGGSSAGTAGVLGQGVKDAQAPCGSSCFRLQCRDLFVAMSIYELIRTANFIVEAWLMSTLINLDNLWWRWVATPCM